MTRPARVDAEEGVYHVISRGTDLILRTPDTHSSQAVQWLKVSYSMWFNAEYNRIGALFQGRSEGVLVDTAESWLLDLSLYVHLNPVRIQKLGLDKKGRKVEEQAENLLNV